MRHASYIVTSNVNILDQYVLCLQGTAAKIIELALDKNEFLSAAVASAAPVPRVRRVPQFIWRPWTSGVLLWIQLNVCDFPFFQTLTLPDIPHAIAEVHLN